MTSIIELDGVVKKFGQKTAVDHLTMTVEEGELFGFLGPNGAGKTTTVRIISTLCDYSEGTVKVCGFDNRKEPEKAKACMGIIQQQISLDKDLTIRENIEYHGRMHLIPKKERDANIRELSEYLGLEEYLDRKVDSLSGGWKKKAAIVCSLVHSPKILFLDEPTAGLDVGSRRLLWELIRKLNDKGTTIFLTSHYIEEIEMLCDRVGIINNGLLMAIDTPDALRTRVGEITVEQTVNGETEFKYFDDREKAKEFIAMHDGEGDISMRRTNLEDCFIQLTGNKVGE